MARAGLGDGWQCVFSNDFDLKKCATYQRNWGGDHLVCGDVKKVRAADLPGTASLAWASFPCQDLSLAGGGAGLRGDRSGTFWPFWDLMRDLIADDRAPAIIALENVCGTLTSHKGKDFAAISKTYRDAGYQFGALVIDAALFLPQSRPRLFMVGVRNDIELPDGVTGADPHPVWHSKALMAAYSKLSQVDHKNWIWWQLPMPPTRTSRFADFIEENPDSVKWHTAAETRRLIAMMSQVNRAKLEAAKKSKKRMVGAIYKRTRRDENNEKVQRAEIRFDEISGCLRTPAGGSSRQLIMVVDGNKVRSRLISTRETARLMGLPDSYALPTNYNEAYHLTGDGVAVDVVRHLAENIFEPVLEHQNNQRRAA